MLLSQALNAVARLEKELVEIKERLDRLEEKIKPIFKPAIMPQEECLPHPDDSTNDWSKL